MKDYTLSLLTRAASCPSVMLLASVGTARWPRGRPLLSCPVDLNLDARESPLQGWLLHPTGTTSDQQNQPLRGVAQAMQRGTSRGLRLSEAVHSENRS